MKTQICMIAYTYYSGDARVRREAEALAVLDEYDVIVLVPKEGNKARSYELDNVMIRELNMKQYQGKGKITYLLSYFLFLTVSFWATTRLFFSGKTDIVHVHNMPDILVFSAIIPRMFGKKIILDIHDSMPETYGAKFGEKSKILIKLLSWEEAISCRIAHKLICVNHLQSRTLIERGIPSEKIIICMNVPDDRLFNLNEIQKQKSAIDKTTKFQIVYHGTLANRLGVDLTIEAVAKLIDKIPTIEFNIIGGGDDFDRFRSLANSLNLNDHVKFEGSIPIHDVAPMVYGMDIGVIANRKNIATELMLPVKMMEYISLDIPVIVPKLKTIQYYFTDDMVSYFEPDDVDSLADTIYALYSDEDKRKMQINNARKFINEYGWAHHKHDFLDMYKELSGNN